MISLLESNDSDKIGLNIKSNKCKKKFSQKF